jgi:Pyrimidine/purine nucleotide 5'-monophosphate nucleosidases
MLIKKTGLNGRFFCLIKVNRLCLKNNRTNNMNEKSLTINAQISPRASLVILSREEITRLRDVTQGGLHELLRRCTLASALPRLRY